MSEQQTEQTPTGQPAVAQGDVATQPEGQPQEQGTPTSYPVSLVVMETGRTHGVSGGATVDLIRDADGNPEVEYALVAELPDGPAVLQTFSFTALNQLAASESARQQSQQQV